MYSRHFSKFACMLCLAMARHIQFLFAENLVPNLMIELYFIIQLLTVRGGDFESLADVSPGNISLVKSLVAKFALQT